MAKIRSKGWSAPFGLFTVTPTDKELAQKKATDSQKTIGRANPKSYDHILTGCRGMPL